jgi:prophage antirepressor-like protein
MNELVVNNWKLVSDVSVLKGAWITAEELGKHLGYTNIEDAVNVIFHRHKKNFVEGVDTSTFNLKGDNYTRLVRIYSERGALKIIRYSNTPVADAVMDEIIEVYLKVRKGESEEENYRKAIAQYEICKQFSISNQVPESLAASTAAAIADRDFNTHLCEMVTKFPIMLGLEEKDMYLEPTELGKEYGLSGIGMNRKLCELGLQIKVNGAWEATEKGKKFCTSHEWTKKEKHGYNYTWSRGKIKGLIK